MAKEKPILVVSNRLPFTLQKVDGSIERKPSSGGLVSAMDPILKKFGGVWLGWPGTSGINDKDLNKKGEPFEIATVSISEGEVGRYYHGFSNRTLWPLFHSLPERTCFDRRDWEIYDKINARFAQKAAEFSSRVDLIWVHDYHLIRVPSHLRKLFTKDKKIAFFLHIPFPPYDIFRLLPWAQRILRGLLACDLVGFHVEAYAKNFLNCCEQLLGARIDKKASLVEHGDRTIQVGAFPLGIDFELFESMAKKSPSRDQMKKEKVILGVDRLDYTKGIPERLLAFERLLEIYPEHREKVTLLQLAVPSRSKVIEYKELKRHIDELVGRINGRFATANWTPIQYLYRSHVQEKLTSLYKNAEIAIVTPLRDGMNLVAKEFVACQVEDPGVLILSYMAGAAETMQEALLVNPYNIDGVAQEIHRALTMEESEKHSRLAALRLRERKNNVFVWGKKFLEAAFSTQGDLSPPSRADFESWLGFFLKNRPLSLFLDYDGTLSSIADHPDQAELTDKMKKALKDCLLTKKIDVTIVSGRSIEDIQKKVKMSEICFAANHGLEIECPKLGSFRHEDLVHFQTKTRDLAKALTSLATSGAWIEEKGPTLTFHFRQVPKSQQVRLAEQIREIIQKFGFQARDAHCAIEARPPIGWDKGHAVLYVLRKRYGPDWSERVRTIYIGDDVTDEDAFRVLKGLGQTFRVGPADTSTAAKRRLPNVEAVEALLEWLVKHYQGNKSPLNVVKPKNATLVH